MFVDGGLLIVEILKKISLYSVLLGGILFSRCSMFTLFGTEAYSRSLDSVKLAVLDFEVEGTLLEDRLGAFVADEMTTALFVKKKINVVDRSQVEAKVKSMHVSVASITPEEIHRFGDAIGAHYLVFGKITGMDNAMIDPGKRGGSTVRVVCRMIDVPSGNVVGMIQRKCAYKDGLKKELSKTIQKMASAVRF